MVDNINDNRAWIEINLDNLKHNIDEIKKVIHGSTKIMAVVKANAYGHGMIPIAKKLKELGIEDFAVATLSEAITLRENDITGNILILGYTSLKDIEYVIKYDLIQTVVDYEYAKQIEALNLSKPLNAHIKINTGMNRIGEKFDHVNNLKEMYQMDCLNVLGTFSHLCVADSLSETDIDFTKKQVDNFNKCIASLKDLGINPGKLHIQASYGILNYSDIELDFVRPGIIMYGVFGSVGDKVNVKIDLRPVLSLKARVTEVKEIEPNESVSYGRTFIADKKCKIATISIGYGYPRCLSGKDVPVLINNNLVPIIGRICMDQLVVNVSNIDDVHPGDIVTLIGENPLISAEQIALYADTISYEILCSLGARLPIIEI